MTDDRIRRAFRTALAPLLEQVPPGPEFAEVTDVAVSVPGPRSRPGWRTGVMAAAAVLFLGALALLNLPPRTPPAGFDIDAFLETKLDGAFEDSGRIAVVVLAAAEREQVVESRIHSLIGLDGFSHLSSNQVDEAAARVAGSAGTAQLEGEWVAYGLIPRFQDSPVEEWASGLGRLADVHVAVTSHQVGPVNIPEGWEHLADLPFPVSEASIIEVVDSGVVVVGRSGTYLVGFDGTWRSGEESPVEIPSACCGDARALPAGDKLVLVTGSTAAWILEPRTLSWSPTEPRPTPGYVLGSAVIGDDLYLVTAAARTGSAVSSVAVLDFDDGTWGSIEAVPSPISVGGVATDGERLFVAGVRQGPGNNVIGDRHPLLYEYTPGAGWEQLPSIPVDGQASTISWVEGVGLLAWNYDLESALWVGDGGWETLPVVPMGIGECYPRSHPTEGGNVGIACGVAWFESSTRTWRSVPDLGWPMPAVAPTALYGFVRINSEDTAFFEYRLDR